MEKIVNHEVHDAPACDAALVHAFGLLGKRWNGILLGTLADGAAGFAELGRAVVGISDSVLAERLVELQGAGLISRQVEPGPPVTVAYQLTPSGEALVPVLAQLGAWARANLV
ncbi:MAG: helix-turn-helix transcriptional regulator [Acidobacteriota bacterium]|nr:helix-turn-helix transcriptional regulator [Acidobacteriota bacterium]MDE3223764.1 helix-turn-helix transcriptional regulator [Acidobacteriota bacterium]